MFFKFGDFADFILANALAAREEVRACPLPLRTDVLIAYSFHDFCRDSLWCFLRNTFGKVNAGR